FEVYRGEHQVPPEVYRSQRTRYLLALLAAHAGRPVAEDLLMEAFWSDKPDKARSNLWSAASYLRRHLRPEGWEGPLDYVVRGPDGLMLNPKLPRWHDLDEFDRSAQEAARHRARNQVEPELECLKRLVQLHRAPYLEGYYADWAIQIRNRVEATLMDAFTRLSVELVRLGRPREALEYATRALELDPCQQEVTLAAMQAQVALQNPVEAIRLYQRCTRVLRKELGIEPTIAIEEMHQRARLILP
ncbi:MAG: bacterial transcriptional activator domain-containing protein, partial [Candidatus Eremiobacterota bacterium]